MESSNAGVLQGNEGDGSVTETRKFGSGLHDVEARSESASDQSDAIPEEVKRKPETPEQQAFVGADGQVHEVPAELIGPDGKMLPLNERTVAMLRNRYFTVRHDKMPCGHKIDRINQPKTNCQICWWGFLNTHSALVQTANEFIQQYGTKRLIALRGRVFVKMFCRFMSTVHHLLEEQKRKEKVYDAEENNESRSPIRETIRDGEVTP